MMKPHKTLIAVFLGILLLSITFGIFCWNASNVNKVAAAKSGSSGDEVMGSAYNLTDVQTLGSMMRAEMGDGDAAFRLFKNYAFASFGKDRRSSAAYWLKKAAENGNEYAQERLIETAITSFRYDQVNARSWLKEVDAKGWKEAKKALARIDDLEARWKRSPILRASPSLDLDEDVRQEREAKTK